MYFSDLLNELVALGFDYKNADVNLLLTTVNLALVELYNRVPILKDVRFATRGQTPIFYCKERTGSPGETIEYIMNGRAFSVRIHGPCQFMIEYGDEVVTNTVSSGPEAQLFRAVIVPGSKISFWGKYSYDLFDFSVYEKAYSDDPEEIPDGSPVVTFDLTLQGDFLSFATPPRDINGRVLNCCRLRDGRLEVDSSYKGEISLSYRRKPTLSISDNNEKPIDVPEDYKHLFLLLMASYVLYDPQSTASKHYRELYEQAVTALLENRSEVFDCYYHKACDWA